MGNSDNRTDHDEIYTDRTEIAIEIAFGETDIWRRPLIETLHEQINFADRVIGVFERRIFQFNQ